MKSIKIILPISFIIAIIIILFCYCNYNELRLNKELIFNEDLDDFVIDKEVKSITKNILKKGCMKNEEGAIEFADLVFKSVYGEDYSDGMELIANYNDNLQYWLVKTELPIGVDGGGKYVIFNNTSLEIIAIWASK